MNRKQKLLLNKLWKNRNNKQRSFIIMVIIPFLLSALYYTFIASDLYVVESRFSVKGNEMQQMDLLSGIAGIGTSTGSTSDSYIVQEYIQSSEILRDIKPKVNIDKIFNHPNADVISRMGKDETQEEQLLYWQKRITVSFDPTTSITTLIVRAFTPQDAKHLSEVIIHQSEKLVNNLSERSRNDDLKFAKQEVDLAEKRVTKAREAMNDFRKNTQDLDPTKTAEARITIIGELDSELAKAQSEYKNLLSYMDVSSPPVITIKSKISALTKQIESEKDRIATKDGQGNKTLGHIFAEYEPLLIERTFAEKAYTSALTSLEAARMEAMRKHRYLATFVEPILPGDAIEPNRIKCISVNLLATSIMWLLGLLLVSLVKEHLGWL